MLSGWALAGIALLVAATLALVFPKRTLIEQVQRESKNDTLALAYLTNLLKTEPGNTELRLLLAEKRLALGNPSLALLTLEPLESDPEPGMRRRVLQLEYRALEAETQNQPPGSAAHKAMQRNRVLALRRLAALEWPVQDLARMAREAAAADETELASALFSRLLANREKLAPEQLAEAAHIAQGAGNYPLAAELLFAAQAGSADLDSRRRYFLNGLRTLQSGMLLREALAAAERHLSDLATDEETLQFLVRLALAANDPARAERYVRVLLRMSWLGYLQFAWAGAMEALIATAHAAQDDAAQAPPKGMRPYDSKLYALAYEVFLANRHVADAYKVAAAAVRQAPNELIWRERLAQVAEWDGKSAEALQQWLYLAQRTGSDAAFQSILRLAPGLNDDQALLYAWKHEIARRTPDAAQWRAIVDLYERLGEPQQGVRLLESAYASKPDPLLLELMASLEERAGRIDEAIANYRRLIEAAGNTPQRAAALATLYLTKSDFRQAYAVLSPLRKQARPDEADYWRLLADLAWQLQQDDAALQAYGVMAARADAESRDAEHLVELMRSRAPQEAARLAETMYRRFGTPVLMLVAAEIHWERRDLVALKRLYAGITPADEARFADNSYFFALRANYFQASGRSRDALADYQRALAIEPEKVDLRTGLLWFLIDARKLPQLRRQLQAYRADASANKAYWAPYAAAYMSLSEPKLAVPWYARELESRRSDYLWLLGYADALEAAGSAAMAWRVRRHAWTETRRQHGDRPPANREALLAYARLATQLAPGDTSLAVLRHLLREDAGTPQPLDAASKELVLSWTLSNEQHEAARIWLWRQYGRKLAKPLWAEVSVALAQDDVVTLERLLASQADAMPAYNRIDAARAVHDVRLAQSYAFEALEKSAHDDELHLRLATDMLATANSVIVRDTVFARGVLAGRERSATLNVWNSPRLRLSIELGEARQTTQDESALTGVPGLDRQAGLSTLMRHERGETEIGIARRSALTEFNSLRIAHTERWAEGLSSVFGLAQSERANETIPLAIGGHRDRALVSLNYNFSKREYLRLEGWRADYHTQHGQSLGAGRGVSYELGHKLRTEYPDASLRYSGTIQHYSPAELADADSARFTRDGSIPTGSFFLPQSFKLQSLNLGLGNATREGYTRALRPYADFGRSYNTLSGNGYNWLLGAAGSVLGPDSLSIYLMRSRGGGGTNIAVKEFGLRYQYFFDRY